MNILFLSSWYPTEKNPNFGVFVKEHAHAIHSTENKIVMLAIVIQRDNKIFETKVIDKLDELGMRVVLIEVNTFFRDIIYHAIPFQYFLVKKVFKKRIQTDFRPDIIHSNVIFPAGIIGYWLSKSLRLPHIITEHWTRVTPFLRNKLVLSSWGKEAYLHATRILPVSKYLQSIIKIELPQITDDKFRVIGNVIDSETFCYKQKKNHPSEIRLCSIATWARLKNPAKQPELLIHAISKLQTQLNIEISLTMIGGGDKLPDLKALCETEKVNAIFTGYLPKSEIAIKLQESDFFVHPTLIETFGVVVVEALLTGTPVICSNVSALQELVTSDNGVLCENTVLDWENALRKAFNMRFNHVQIASDIKQKYDLKNIGIAIDSVYKELV
jgi:glycosyltransferase involved in cell wall biosynthesis